MYLAECPRFPFFAAQRIETLKQITETGIHRLFHLHLQNLRDHFGRWYETILDNLSANGLGADHASSQRARELLRQNAARRAEEEFIKAALGSIPQTCRHPGGGLCEEMAGRYGFEEALRGLLEDMYEATSTRRLEEEEWKDIVDVSIEDDSVQPGDGTGLHVSSKARVGLRQLIKNIRNKKQKRKWYERLAGKGLVIGANYIQGWMMLQALRREARRRDLSMPKFPLF